MSALRIKQLRRDDVVTLIDGSRWRVLSVCGDDIELVNLKSSVRNTWRTTIDRVVSQVDEKRRPRS